ncbi:MAG: hypothetical protein GY803_19580 [Chloroflexi bacterium]|nr:hypothetical protein [Chloroflexota bacterium]
MKQRLGSIEQMWALAGEFSGFAAVSVLHLQNGPDPDTLRQALNQLQRRQPLLQAKIEVKNRRFYFAFPPNVPPIPLQIAARQDGEQWRQAATEALNQTLDIGVAPLMRCVYLYQPEPDTTVDLIFIYHHAIIDAVSSLNFYEQLLSLCAGLDVDLSPLPSLPSADALFPPEAQGLRRLGKILGYMGRQMTDEWQFQRRLGKNARVPPIPPTANGRTLTRQLDEETTKALVRQSRRHRATMYTVLSTAMLLAVHKHLYQSQKRPLRALTFTDLRPFLNPPVANEYLGCYISMLRHTINLDGRPDFWATVRAFQESAARLTQYGEKYASPLMGKHILKMLIRYQPFRMGATAVSYIGPVKLKPAYGSTQITGLHGFISNNQLGPEYSAFGKILFGQLSWDILYLDTDMDEATAVIIADEMVAILTEISRHE